MALYHLHVKNISRSDGRSAVAAAAYRAGVTLENEAEERQSKFAGRRDVLWAEIHLPAGAPAWMTDRAVLWNAVETIERRKDARLAKEVEFSIPRELAPDAWLEVARTMAQHFTDQGFVVDLAMHDDGTGHNPHAHLMLTTRAVSAAGFGPKLRAADNKAFLKATRVAWQSVANAALAKAVFPVKIDASSYAARGIEREPGTRHAPDPEARRRRREEVASMLRDSDLIRARDSLLQEPDIRDRYPRLAQDIDWPPQTRPASSVLPDARSLERERFWQEVRERAIGEQERPEGIQEPDRDAPASRPDAVQATSADLNQTVKSLWDKMQGALVGGEAERRQSRAEHAQEFQRTFEQLHARLAQTGILTPEGARLWEQIEGRFRTSDFYDLLAEARRIEAKRNERGQMPEATPAQKRQVAALEREAQLREGVEFKPQTRTMPLPLPQQPATAPAQAAMVREYHQPAEPSPAYPVPLPDSPARAQPIDPFTLLAQRGQAAAAAHTAARAAPEQGSHRQPPDPFSFLKPKAPAPEDAEATRDRERTRDREWER